MLLTESYNWNHGERLQLQFEVVKDLEFDKQLIITQVLHFDFFESGTEAEHFVVASFRHDTVIVA